MDLQNNLYVISLTHWDREWRFPFQKTRMLLVEMMDELLETLEHNDPPYGVFHLDGHTILLDDYCAIRPENAERIRRFVTSGKLKIGPWYVLPEENQMTGESLVRNFLWGEKTGRKYGGNMKVGYSPTSWGQVSQLPQIMNGFGIDSVVFYRGISADQVPGNYYLWEAPDGSRLFAVRLGDYARSSFFHLVDRPVCFNRTRKDQSHDWSLGGKPFRLCGSGSSAPYHFYQPPMGFYPENIPQAFKELEEVDLKKWETPFALAFECDDSTGPFIMTPKIIQEANKLITNGKKIIHADLEKAIAEAREYLDENDLVVMKGEMRYPQRAGVWTDLYAEVQAERIPMKYANRRAEYALQRGAEPLSVIAWMLGADYPRAHLDDAWNLLLQSHAHDSIGGCGRDEIHEEVEFRFKQVDILSRTMVENAAREIAGRIDTSAFNPDDILLVVFNTLPRPVSRTVVAEIDIDRDRKVLGFQVKDLDGVDAPVQIINKYDFLAVFNHPHELPLRTWSNRWEFYFRADDIPAFGYKVFRIEPAAGEMRHPGTMRIDALTMKNDYMTVTVNPNGSADIVDANGRTLSGLNVFEDRGDVGDYWIGRFPTKDRIVYSTGCAADISVIEDGPLSCAIEAKLTLRVPIRAKQDASARGEEFCDIGITTVYRLVDGERFLRIRTTIDNTAEDHILRALFPTDITTDVAHAHAPFDVVQRSIPLPDTRDWREPYKPVQPQREFVDLSDGTRGVAILNRGLPQYEAVDDARRTIALTLIRANRAWNSVRLAHYPDQSGTQLKGVFTFDYAVFPHDGDWDAGGVLAESEAFNIDPIAGAAGPGSGQLPLIQSFLEIHGDGLVMDALKQGEWDTDSLIIRISNPTSRAIDGKITLRAKIASAEQVNMMETEVLDTCPVIGSTISLSVPAKKIVTLRVRLKK